MALFGAATTTTATTTTTTTTTTRTRTRTRRRRSWNLAHASQVHSHSTWKCDKSFSGIVRRKWKRHQLPSPSPDHCQKALGRCQPSEIDVEVEKLVKSREKDKEKTGEHMLREKKNPRNSRNPKSWNWQHFGGKFPYHFHHHFLGWPRLEIMDVSMKGMCFAWSQSPNVLCLFLCLGLGDFGKAEPWVLGGIGGLIQCWSQENRIKKKQLLGFITGSKPKKMGPQARCTKNVQRLLQKMCKAPKMADIMCSNLSTFQSYLFLRKWVKNRSHLPSSWSALISRAVLPAAPFYSPGSPNIFITFLVSSSPSWSLIPMFFFPL